MYCVFMCLPVWILKTHQMLISLCKTFQAQDPNGICKQPNIPHKLQWIFFPTLLWYHFCSVECFFFTALISTIILGLLLQHHHYPLPFLSKAFSLQCYTRRVQSRVLIFQLTSIGLFALLEKQGRGKLFFVLTWRRPTQRKKRCPQRINSPNFKLSSP